MYKAPAPVDLVPQGPQPSGNGQASTWPLQSRRFRAAPWLVLEGVPCISLAHSERVQGGAGCSVSAC